MPGPSTLNQQSDGAVGRGIVALTGGIGAGKSTVAAMLADRGAYVVDADQLARDVLAPGSSGFADVVAAFGQDVVTLDGELNRAALAGIVFNDGEALAQLEAITHPRVEQRAKELFSIAPSGAMLVYDVPLLTDDAARPDAPDTFAAIVVVDASDETRLSRLVARGLDPDDATRRMKAQLTREQRLAIADFVVPNDGSLDELRGHVDHLWGLLTQRLSGTGFTV